MKEFIKHIICKLYYKYCFKNDELSSHLIIYYLPRLMRKELCGCPIDGKFLFAQIENNCNNELNKSGIKLNPILDINFNLGDEYK